MYLAKTIELVQLVQQSLSVEHYKYVSFSTRVIIMSFYAYNFSNRTSTSCITGDGSGIVIY